VEAAGEFTQCAATAAVGACTASATGLSADGRNSAAETGRRCATTTAPGAQIARRPVAPAAGVEAAHPALAAGIRTDRRSTRVSTRAAVRGARLTADSGGGGHWHMRLPVPARGAVLAIAGQQLHEAQ